MIIIDGSHGEGGGQILRTSLSLSALSSRPVTITNIRKNRPKPGLSHQHLTTARSAAEVCGAEIRGCELGSGKLEFIPSTIRDGDYEFDIRTAGSVVLVLQTILPMLLKTRSSVVLTGGTDVKWSPSFDYFRHVFLPLLKRMGAQVECSLERRGHYPWGGGRVSLETRPSVLRSILLHERGALRGISGTVHVSDLPERIGHRIRESATRHLRERLGSTVPGIHHQIDISLSREEGSPGCGVTLWSEFEHTVMGYGLCGERGLPSEKLGRLAATTLAREMLSPATLDEWCSDQLIPYLACHELFAGKGQPAHRPGETPAQPPFLVRAISPHLETNIWVLEKFGFRVNREMVNDAGTHQHAVK